MKFKLIILLILSIQSIANEFTKALTDAAKRAYLINVNAVMLFTSQDMLSSGKYKFGDDDKIHIMNLPFIHHFNPYNRYLNFYVNGSAGYSRRDESLDINKLFGTSGLPNDHVEFDTYALKLGGGVRVTPGYDLEMLFGGALIYTHIKNSYDYNSPESEAILKPAFDEVFANKNSDNFSYEFFMQYGYFPDFSGWKPYTLLSFHFFETHSDLTINGNDYTTNSSVSKLKAGLRTPELVSVYHVPMSLGGFIEGNLIHGDLDVDLGFDRYGAVGASLHFGTKFYTDLIEELSVEYSRVDGDGISGYNIGMGFDIAF